MIGIISFTLGLLIGGGFFYKKLKKETEKLKEEAKKSLDTMYHKGFESGMEKANADLMATISAYEESERKKDEELTKLADKMLFEITAETKHAECSADCDHEAIYKIEIPEPVKKKKKKTTKKAKKKSKK